MQALHFLGKGELEWQETQDPELGGPGEALVRPLAVATCDLDGAIIAGVAPFKPPFVLGHETVGEVVAVGEAVTSFSPGDRVVVPFQISCGSCSFCRRGLTASCTEVPRTAMYGVGESAGGFGGALADVLRVPFAEAMLLPLPQTVSPGLAARLGDNVADALRTVAPQLEARPGAEVLVLSGGVKSSIPLYAVLAATSLGASAVHFYDSNRSRLEVAESLGARVEEVREWPKRLGSFPITVDSTVDPAGLACALRSTEPGGHCTSTSIYFQDPIGLPLFEMYMKGVVFETGRVHSRGELPKVLALVESGRLDPDRIPANTAPWSSAREALLDYAHKLVIER